MECSQVLSLLSRYLDGDLAPDVRRMVEDHLSSCTGCSLRVEELVESVRAVRSLERIAAPQDFLSKVRRRIEEPSPSRGFFRKLFSPLYVKLPLEAVGLGIAVLLFIIVHRNIAPMKEEAPVPRMTETTASAPTPAPSENTAAALQEKDYRTLSTPGPAEETVRNESSPSAQPTQLAGRAPGVRPGTPPAGLTAAPQSSAPAAAREVQPPPQSGRLIQLTLLTTPSHKDDEAAKGYAPPAAAPFLSNSAVPPPPARLRAGRGEAAQDALKSTAQNEPRALPKLAKPSPGKRALSDSSKGGEHPTNDPDAALALIRRCAAETGATLLETATQSETGAPRSVVIEVPVSNYSAFLKGLEHIGPLRAPYPKTPPPDAAETVRVRISFLISR